MGLNQDITNLGLGFRESRYCRIRGFNPWGRSLHGGSHQFLVIDSSTWRFPCKRLSMQSWIRKNYVHSENTNPWRTLGFSLTRFAADVESLARLYFRSFLLTPSKS